MKLQKIRKIPTLIGLAIVFMGLAVSIFLVERSQNIFLKAKAENTPNQVKISNITSHSFTVSWFTAQPTTALIKFGTEPTALNFEAHDERDSEGGEKGNYFSHYVNLTDLEPSTIYFFKIQVDSQSYDENGRPYQVTTAPEIGASTLPNDLAYGIILNINSLPAEGAIVYLNLANSSLQSCLVSSAGNWAVPLNLTRTDDLSRYIAYDPEASIIEIFVRYEEQTASAVTTTSNDSPVPPITIGETFDFRTKTLVKPEEKIPPPSGFSLEEQPATPSFSLSIINPQEGEAISTQKPEFFGKGPIGKEITITIESPQFTTQIFPNQWGDWNWAPPQHLEPGEHSITAFYIDEEGKEHLISRVFTVLAAETSDLPSFTATPSATPTEKPSPTASSPPEKTPTPTSIVKPTATPTIKPTPTSEPEVTPTVTPSPIYTPTPSLTPAPEATLTPTATPPGEEIQPGILTPTLIVFIMGAVLLSSGLLMTIF